MGQKENAEERVRNHKRGKISVHRNSLLKVNLYFSMILYHERFKFHVMRFFTNFLIIVKVRKR